jgi:hypothetical protein
MDQIVHGVSEVLFPLGISDLVFHREMALGHHREWIWEVIEEDSGAWEV